MAVTSKLELIGIGIDGYDLCTNIAVLSLALSLCIQFL